MSRIMRSNLIVPSNVKRYLEKAARLAPDTIVLDLEDSIPEPEKDNARQGIEEAFSIVGAGSTPVLVRVNNRPDHLASDMDAAVIPGVSGLLFPKAESADQVIWVSDQLARLEGNRGLEVGEVGLSLEIESPKGLLNLEEIAIASPRVVSMDIGVEDYCLALGVSPSKEASELLYPLSRMVTVCKAYSIKPLGLLGSLAEFKDIEKFERSARGSCQLGCEGAFCIHPDQIPILNRVFSPDPKKLSWAERVVEEFEKSLEQGRASTSLDGRMVDEPVYQRARYFLDQALELTEFVNRKKRAD